MRSRWWITGGLIEIAVILWITAAHSTPSDYLGLPVRYVRIESAYPYAQKSVLDALDVHEGEMLTATKIRSSIRYLSLLNKFNQIRVTTRPFLDGCAVTFHLEPEWIVHRLKFKGSQTGYLFAYGIESRISLKDIMRECELAENEVFSEQKLQNTVESLKQLYVEYGYGRCSVTASVDRNYNNKTVDVVFRINKKQPTHIRRVTFTGDHAIDNETLQGIVKSRPGLRYLNRTLKNDQERLREYFLKKGYLSARIYRPETEIDFDKNTIDITVRIDAGDRSRILISAPKHWWNADWWLYRFEKRPQTILDILSLGDTDIIEDELLGKGRENLERSYWDRGYSHARVNLEQDTQDESLHIFHYQVEEGPKVTVASVTITGNQDINTRTFSEMKLLMTKPGSIYHYDIFQMDIQAMLQYYLDHGYKDVAITTSETSDSELHNRVNLVIAINEGAKYIIESVVVEGNTLFSSEAVMDILELSPGMPYNQQKLEQGVARIITGYQQKGYADVAIRPDIQIDSLKATAALTIQVEEGTPSRFGKVLLTGFRKTKQQFLERNLPEIEGQPFYFETLFDAQRKLSATGLFSSVQARTLPGENGDIRRTVIVSVKERPTLFLESGPGYSTDIGFNGYLSFYTTNLYGTNRYLGNSLFVSEKSEKTQVSYREPEFASYPIQFEIRLLRNITEENGYKLYRIGGRATWSYHLSKYSRTFLEYRFDDDRPRDIQPGSSIPEDYRNSVKIGSLSPGILIDTRDDPRDPKKGHLLSLQIEFGRPAYNSEIDFTRTTLETTLFNELSKNKILGLSFRAGWGRDLPFQEKFKLGGIKTIRGWGYEKLRGPKPSGIIKYGYGLEGIGGNISLLGNIEYRVPLFWGLQSVIFTDAGNVWDSVEHVDLNEIKATIGLGIRFMTPVGPVGLDYGYNMLRNSDDPSDRWSFIIGHTF